MRRSSALSNPGSASILANDRSWLMRWHVRSSCWQTSRTLGSASDDADTGGCLLPDVGYHIYYVRRTRRVEVVTATSDICPSTGQFGHAML